MTKPQTLAAQLLMLLVIAAAFGLNLRSARRSGTLAAQQPTEKAYNNELKGTVP